jgi:hypothetical protein
MNNMFWAFVPSVVAFYAAACFLRHKEKALQSWFFPTMMLLASFLTIWLLSFEIINFDPEAPTWRWSACGVCTDSLWHMWELGRVGSGFAWAGMHWWG